MKKNKMMRIASVLLVAVLLSTCVISGTFAKYTSESTGSSSARVAKWDIQFEGAAIASAFSFELFETVNDANVATGSGENIIAPGTSGSFTFNFTNDSEVTAKYGIDFTVTNTDNIPVQFSVDGGASWGDLEDVTEQALAMDADATYTVQWRWVFDGDDSADTTLGLAGTATITVEAKVTVDQVD